MRVAVVGAGISGLTAAYLLRAQHEATVFERDSHAGGHANTVLVPRGTGSPAAVDTGFIVYNEVTYPGFSALLRDLRVLTQPGDMSFGCACERCGIAFSSRGLSGLFAARKNLASRAHWALLPGLSRFYGHARRVLAHAAPPNLTLGEYLERTGPTRAVATHYLLPMAAAIWSSPPERATEIPFAQLVRFLDNHGLIGRRPRLRWRTVTGGSREYVARLVAALPPDTVRRGSPVEMVCRDDGGVTVHTAGKAERFDAIVLACHADEALALLGDSTPEEHCALGAFAYTSNRVVLHTDAGVLPRQKAAHASWNVSTADCRQLAPRLTMTYDMNRLQAVRGPGRYLVSVNPGEFDRHSVISEHTYEHPQFTWRTPAAQAAVAALQGKRSTYYAGAHLGYGFHEDGYQSGARVAALLSARP